MGKEDLDDPHILIGISDRKESIEAAKRKQKQIAKDADNMSKVLMPCKKRKFLATMEIGNERKRSHVGRLKDRRKRSARSNNLLKWPILHKYANEAMSIGAWFIGFEVDHIDDRNNQIGTRRHKRAMYALLRTTRAAVEKMKFVHESCGEGEDTLWNALVRGYTIIIGFHRLIVVGAIESMKQ